MTIIVLPSSFTVLLTPITVRKTKVTAQPRLIWKEYTTGTLAREVAVSLLAVLSFNKSFLEVMDNIALISFMVTMFKRCMIYEIRVRIHKTFLGR